MKQFLYTLVFLTALLSMVATTAPKNGKSGVRAESGAALYELGISKISNHEFYTSNYGIVGLNIQSGGAGWFWPKKSGRAYIYGCGMWFGAKKIIGMDTLKVVSVGYNPNSGSGWFGPGRIDDGPNVLDEADPRSLNYVLYRSTDYNAEGKNIVNSARPDWPIRWTNLTKIPGKNGYYGDYVADPASRSAYQPVYISQEDFFSVYKDTDIRRNPEYKAGSGYPLGIEVEQTIYTWGFDGHKDLAFTVYNIRNKSGIALKDCFLSSALDPDIGSAVNDHTAYYSKDSSLNVAFLFTEPETGFPGVLGFDFLESPTIKTPEDSANFRKKTGRIRNVGEQIGLTTVRNWVIENDPSGSTARYDFMAANIREGDNGPGDKRLLFATGPFTMNAGDSARIVMCTMIAPGIGNPLLGDVQSNGYLDSLISLDKYAQAIFENDRLSEFPTASVQTNINGALAEISIVVDASRVDGKTVIGKLMTSANTVVGQGALFDDGTHNDGAAGDKIFGGTLWVAAQASGLSLNAQITNESNQTYEWISLAWNITTTKLVLGKPLIFSDNINGDGLANKGEGIRFGIPIANSYAFPFSNVSVELIASSIFSAGQNTIPSLTAESQFNPTYDANNPGSYFQYSIPSNYPGPKIVFDVQMSDNTGNKWSGSIEIDVFESFPDKAVSTRLSGRSSLVPNIYIVDKGITQSHSFILHGVDSVDASKTIGFSLKNSTTGSYVFQNIPLNSNSIVGFTTSPVNGFKVNWKGVYANTMGVQSFRYYTNDSMSFPWFSSALATTGNNIGGTFPPGNLDYGDYRDVQVRFSKKTSFTDVNVNFKLDSGEPYSFDSANAERSQRAYFYRRDTPFTSSWSYAGFRSVPFAAFDIETGSPRQLDVVVLDNDKNNQWDFDQSGTTTKLNNIFVMNTTYDPEGKNYDSTKGGKNLIPTFRYRLAAPIYFMLNVVSNGISPLGAEGDIKLLTTRPLTSRDEFLFNPTIYTGLTSGVGMPEKYSLSQNYPNPFNPVTTIRYTVQQQSRVTLTVYNVLGQMVKSIVNREQEAGQYEAQWDGTNLADYPVSSGIYFYKIEAGTFTEVRKMLLMR